MVAVSGVVGASTSYISGLLNIKMFGLSQLPHISYASTAAYLSVYDYFFRTVPSDSLQARAMADIIVHFNWTYIFALFSDDDYGRDGINVLTAVLESKNYTQSCIAKRIPLPYRPSNSQDYDEIIESMSQEWV